MTLRRIAAAALVAALLGAVPKTHHHPRSRPRETVYSAPAGDRSTGVPDAARPFDAILPNGRIVAPIGQSTIVGADARGIALSPDGRYAVVGTASGVTVVDTASMRVTAALDLDGGVSPGIAIESDPQDATKTLVIAAGAADDRLHLLDLGDDGTLTPDGDPIAMPSVDASATQGAFVPSIALSVDGHTAYVTHRIGDSLSAIDLVRRRVLSDTVAGFSPAGVALASDRVYVTNEGFGSDASGAPDLDRSSSLDVLTAQTDGDIDGDPSSASVVRLDPFPDGVKTIGGAHPSALTLSPDGQFAFICMTGVDRVEVVGLTGTPHAVGGISMQLYTKWPYGTQPVAIAGSSNGRRLYVALSSVNAIAILDSSDPLKMRRLGLLPAGWYPSALALSPDGRYLFVVNSRGTVGTDSATLQRIDLHGIAPGPATLAALRYNRLATFARPDALVPSMPSHQRSTKISHVVFIAVDGAPLDDATAASVAPNLIALTRAFASAGNFTPDAGDSDLALQFALGGMATAYQRSARAPSPEGFPRTGYIFDSLARAGRSYRDYGTLNGLPALTGHEGPAADFIDDYAALPSAPAFVAIRLRAASDPADTSEDAALGSIVDSLTHGPQWASTAIFIIDRGRAVVVSPYARRGYVGRRHISTVSVLKTEEELLGLPALTLDDLLATDLSDFFTSVPDSASFVAQGVEQPSSQ